MNKNIKIRFIDSKKIWEDFCLSFPNTTFLQSWNWGEFEKSLGEKILRLGFFKNNELKGIGLVIKKKAKRGDYLECPGGPLIDFKQTDYFKLFLKEIKKIAKKEKCFFIRVRPQLKDNSENSLLFKKAGFHKSPMHLHAERTWQIDLKKSEEDILMDMRKNTRYMVRKSLKIDFKVEQSLLVRDVDYLYDLQMKTVKRQKFVPFSKEYFQKELLAFKDDDKIRLFKISYKGRVLAAAFIVFYAETAYYHYSGTSLEFPKLPVSYRLQWEAVKEAKKRGLRVYDLWGVAPENKPNHRFAGVSLFKKGFGGQGLNYLPAQDLPFKKLYWSIYVFEYLRKISRGL
jgi:lipid II:glycine glycyltransferase (peptidoglycan interpeptide bridge formation enzyme)